MLFDRANSFRCIPVLAAVALLGLAGRPALAQGVVSSTNVTFLTAPVNAAEGANPSDTTVSAFMENQNLVLTGNQNLNISTPGTYNTSTLSPGSIPKKTVVDSFYIYSDPLTSGSHTFTGSITFNSDILGLEVNSNTLNNTDALFGTATNYPSSDNNRGLELNGTGDSVTLSSDRRTLNWSFTTKGSVDSIRILTAVPEPTMALPMGLMLLTGLVLWRRKPARAGQPA